MDYDIDDDETMNDDEPVPSNKYFRWRDAEVLSGTHNMELSRIIPDPTETFNGPYYQIPCAWDKLVSNSKIYLHLSHDNHLTLYFNTEVLFNFHRRDVKHICKLLFLNNNKEAMRKKPINL